MQKKLASLKATDPAAYEHFSGLQLSEFTTAALPPGVCTFSETTNNAAEVFMHMAADIRRQNSFLASLMRTDQLVARRLKELHASIPPIDPLQVASSNP